MLKPSIDWSDPIWLDCRKTNKHLNTGGRMPRLAQVSYVGLLRFFVASLAFAGVQSTTAQVPTSKPAEAAPGKAVPAAPASGSEGATALAHFHVYRQHRYTGAGLAPSIFVDDKQVVRIGNGRRASIKLSPGPHTIRSDDKSSAISIDAKPGQDYFVRVDEEAGFWKGHGKLTMILPEQGSAEYKLQKPVEEDRKTAREMIEPDTEEATSNNDAKHKTN